MKAIDIKAFGGPEELFITEIDKPHFEKKEVLVKIKSTALNRADTMQRRGTYPPPPGASPILGLEMAGVIEAVGAEVTNWKVGDRVCGLLSGGGYAEYVNINQDLLMPIPDNWSFQEAAAVPEVFLTAFQAVHYLGQIQEGESLLIHAGASGVGTAATQLASAMGAKTIIVTASAGKHALCKELGVDHTIDYKTQNFETEVNQITNGKGVDVIIDFLAAAYFQQNINSLATDGRLVMLSLLGGIKVADFNLVNILRKRLHIKGSTLRARTLEYKIQLTKDFVDFAFPKFESKILKPIIDSVYDWRDVSEAHAYMEANKNKGKIILNVS